MTDTVLELEDVVGDDSNKLQDATHRDIILSVERLKASQDHGLEMIHSRLDDVVKDIGVMRGSLAKNWEKTDAHEIELAYQRGKQNEQKKHPTNDNDAAIIVKPAAVKILLLASGALVLLIVLVAELVGVKLLGLFSSQ